MGNCRPEKRSPEQEEAHLVSKLIDGQLRKERKMMNNKIKLLLLGAGDSGKSTFLKQMMILHKDGLEGAERILWIKVLQENCLCSMQKILQNDSVKIPKNRKEAKKLVMQAITDDFPKVSGQIYQLWQEKTIKDAYEHRKQLNIDIPSSSDYYFENVERFADKNFQPTSEDILRSTIKSTTGVYEFVFLMDDIEFTIVDVDRSSHPRKWLPLLDDHLITSVIFLAALDDYDVPSSIDPSTNRLEESLRLWEEVTSLKYFNPLSWILFLNKSDLFESKIKKVPLTKIFPDFPAGKGSNFEEGIKYMQNRYSHAWKPWRTGSLFYNFVICARNTTYCLTIWHTVQHTLITRDLNAAAM